MAIVPNCVETFPKISIAWVGCTNVTDRRQTPYRRTDDDMSEFTFAKNHRSPLVGTKLYWLVKRVDNLPKSLHLHNTYMYPAASHISYWQAVDLVCTLSVDIQLQFSKIRLISLLNNAVLSFVNHFIRRVFYADLNGCWRFRFYAAAVMCLLLLDISIFCLLQNYQ